MLSDVTMRNKLKLLERFPNPEEIYSREDLLPDVSNNRDLREAEIIVNRCKREHIDILSFGDTAYPQQLRNIADPPLVLYYKGLLPDFASHPSIGVVGTRKATPYALNQAERIAKQIATCGGIVISGGAAGIDSRALEGALPYPCVAVLGCGVNVVYPRNNRRLFTKVQENGCLLSEYPPGTEPKPWYFPARNRIISGLCNGVLVVEAPRKSGALITARDALEQDRDVFVVPGNIDNDTCAGSNALLQEGAYAVFSGWDTLKGYASRYPDTVSQKQERKSAVTESPVPVDDKKVIDNPTDKTYSVLENENTDRAELEKALLACISRTPKPIDAVIAESGMPAAQVLRMLTVLSLQGVVINHPGKLVSLNKQ